MGTALGPIGNASHLSHGEESKTMIHSGGGWSSWNYSIGTSVQSYASANAWPSNTDVKMKIEDRDKNR